MEVSVEGVVVEEGQGEVGEKAVASGMARRSRWTIENLKAAFPKALGGEQPLRQGGVGHRPCERTGCGPRL